MKKLLAVLALLVWAGSSFADSNTYNYLGAGPYFNSRNGARVDAEGNAQTTDAARDRDLDFGATNLVASVAIDSGGVGGANFRYSAPVDVRQYGTGRIIIHITQASAADTVGIYDYGVTVFPLTQGAIDWTGVGVPISTNPYPVIKEGVAAQSDSLGFWSITPNAVNVLQGERKVRLQTDRTTSNYANVNAMQTASFSWDVWLGAGAKPRYLLVQIRLIAKTITGNLTPSVRVDLEGLR